MAKYNLGDKFSPRGVRGHFQTYEVTEVKYENYNDVTYELTNTFSKLKFYVSESAIDECYWKKMQKK
jgi:hypothetical protein